MKTFNEIKSIEGQVSKVANNYGYNIDGHTPYSKAEHIAFCNGFRKGEESMWLKLNEETASLQSTIKELRALNTKIQDDCCGQINNYQERIKQLMDENKGCN